MTGSRQGFGDEAAEMANETEVEETPSTGGSSAPAEGVEASHDVEGAEAPDAPAAEAPAPAAEDQGRDELAERTADLQRLTAEYANYRKRVERDRQVTAENERYKVLTPIIDVLDTIDRAREHGDLDPGFQSVADQLERVVTGLGLARFGAPGDAFDPNVHEALSHIGEDPEVEVTTAKVIAKAGYRIGDRVVRAAPVLVVDPVS